MGSRHTAERVATGAPDGGQPWLAISSFRMATSAAVTLSRAVTEQAYPVSPILFRTVEGEVRSGQQVKKIAAMCAEHRHTYGHRDSDGLLVDRNNRFAHAQPHSLGDAARLNDTCVGQEGNELLAAEPSDEIGVVDKRTHRVRDRGEDPVADQMTAGVVYPLEMVDVDEQDREGVASANRPADLEIGFPLPGGGVK